MDKLYQLFQLLKCIHWYLERDRRDRDVDIDNETDGIKKEHWYDHLFELYEIQVVRMIYRWFYFLLRTIDDDIKEIWLFIITDSITSESKGGVVTGREKSLCQLLFPGTPETH